MADTIQEKAIENQQPVDLPKQPKAQKEETLAKSIPTKGENVVQPKAAPEIPKKQSQPMADAKISNIKAPNPPQKVGPKPNAKKSIPKKIDKEAKVQPKKPTK